MNQLSQVSTLAPTRCLLKSYTVDELHCLGSLSSTSFDEREPERGDGGGGLNQKRIKSNQIKSSQIKHKKTKIENDITTPEIKMCFFQEFVTARELVVWFPQNNNGDRQPGRTTRTTANCGARSIMLRSPDLYVFTIVSTPRAGLGHIETPAAGQSHMMF
jgi:hypothetical protein